MSDIATATSILCYHVSEWNHDRIKHQAVLDSVDEWYRVHSDPPKPEDESDVQLSDDSESDYEASNTRGRM